MRHLKKGLKDQNRNIATLSGFQNNHVSTYHLYIAITKKQVDYKGLPQKIYFPNDVKFIEDGIGIPQGVQISTKDIELQ